MYSQPVGKDDVLVIRLWQGHVSSVRWRDESGNELTALCKIDVVCDCVECEPEPPLDAAKDG